jgi:hypothetical protein
MTEPTYLTVRTLNDGRPLDYIVSGGLGGKSFGVYKRRPGERSIHRLTSPLTPIRETPEAAEIDLAIYAATRLLLPGPTRELVERYILAWQRTQNETLRLHSERDTARAEADAANEAMQVMGVMWHEAERERDEAIKRAEEVERALDKWRERAELLAVAALRAAPAEEGER